MPRSRFGDPSDGFVPTIVRLWYQHTNLWNHPNFQTVTCELLQRLLAQEMLEEGQPKERPVRA